MNNKISQNGGNNSDNFSNNIATNQNKKVLLETEDDTDFSTIEHIQDERGVSWSIISYRDNPNSSNASKIYRYKNSTDSNLTNKYLVVTENGAFVLSAEVNSESNNKRVRLDSKVSDGLSSINQRWILENYKTPTDGERKSPKIESIFIEYENTDSSVSELDGDNVDTALVTESKYNKNRKTIPIEKVESKKNTLKVSIDNYSRFSIVNKPDDKLNLVISLRGIDSDIERPYSVKIQVNLDDGTTDTITTNINDARD